MNFDILRFDKTISNASLNEMALKVDQFMLTLLWLHLPFAAFFIPHSYGTWREGLLAGSVICIIGTISYIFSRGTFAHRVLNGLLLLSYSIVFISIQYGRIEMHFHVFLALPVLILYRDWKVIPPAGLLISVHHAVFSYCQANAIDLAGFPLVAFNYDNGWDIVFLHPIFVVFQCSLLSYYSESLKKQHIEIFNTNEDLETIVKTRTSSLEKEKEQIEAYKKALDQVAITALADQNGKLLRVNKNFEKITGYSQKEVIVDEFHILHSHYHDPEFFSRVWKQISQGNVWRGEMKSQSKTGEDYWVDAAIAPIQNSEGKIEKFVTIRLDSTKRKSDEKTIVQQQEKIVSQSQLSALGEMAGGIAHEINNPLAIISTATKTMRKMSEKNMLHTEHFGETLNDMDSTILRITKIVEGLRNVSRDPSNEDFDECTLEDLLQDVLSLFSEKLRSHDIDFTLQVPQEVRFKAVQIMRVQISQVILNLLTNAYHAVLTAKEKWIQLAIEENNGNIVFKISDSGAGIPIEIQKKIFQPFFTTKEVGKGTGLGLSLSLSIINRHRGKFYLDNKNSNTCFIVSIPMRQSTRNTSKTIVA